MAETLRALPNIGAVAAGLLTEAGIDTPGKLRHTGAQQAWLALQKLDSTVCLSMLYGLQGAVQGVRWHQLDADTKKDLKAFYERHKMD